MGPILAFLLAHLRDLLDICFAGGMDISDMTIFTGEFKKKERR